MKEIESEIKEAVEDRFFSIVCVCVFVCNVAGANTAQWLLYFPFFYVIEPITIVIVYYKVCRLYYVWPV